MGSLGSPGPACSTPKHSPRFRHGPFSTSRKQRAKTEGGSCKMRILSGSSSPGRFIPRRFSMDMEAASFGLLSRSQSIGSTELVNEVFEDVPNWGGTSSTAVKYQRQRLAVLSQGASERKILHFGPEPFARRENEQRRRSECSSVEQIGMTFARPSRRLPKYPRHVLDLPKLVDDFFTHNMCWSADGHLVAGLHTRLYTCILEGEGTTMLHDLSSSNTGRAATYTAVACNSSGTRLAASTTNSKIQIWDLKSLKNVRTITHVHHRTSTSYDALVCSLVSMDWKPNSDVLAVGCGFGIVDIIDMKSNSNTQIALEETQVTCISGLKFSPNGRYLAISNSRHKLIVWDMTTLHKGIPLLCREAHTSAIRALSWYPHKNSILTSGGGIDDGLIKFWNIHTGQKIKELAVNAQVCEVLWSPETGELLSSQSVLDKHSVVVWDYPDLNKVGSLAGHGGRVLHMALSPDQRYLATAAADETLRIWNLKPDSGSSQSSAKSAPSFVMQGLR